MECKDIINGEEFTFRVEKDEKGLKVSGNHLFDTDDKTLKNKVTVNLSYQDEIELTDKIKEDFVKQYWAYLRFYAEGLRDSNVVVEEVKL